jgi:hypothetical protein
MASITDLQRLKQDVRLVRMTSSHFNQHLDRAETLGDGGHAFLHGAEVTDVELECGHTRRVLEGLRLLFIPAVIRRDLVAAQVQRFGDGAADTTGSAGDQRNTSNHFILHCESFSPPAKSDAPSSDLVVGVPIGNSSKRGSIELAATRRSIRAFRRVAGR